MPSLEDWKYQTVKQADRKKWNNKTDFLVEKLQEEWNELQVAIEHDTPESISEEIQDIRIVLAQIENNECVGINSDQAYHDKLMDNYSMKKKTKNENGEWVKR